MADLAPHELRVQLAGTAAVWQGVRDVEDGLAGSTEKSEYGANTVGHDHD